MNDLRFALRQLLKNPGFAAVAALTLALGIGANLTTFAVVDAVLVRSLPFPAAERLVTIYNTYPKAGVDRDGGSIANYYERRGAIPAFSSLSLFRPDTAIVGEPGSTVQADVLQVSPDFFTTLGMGPVIGRAFTEEETTSPSDGVVILADGYWREFFNADPSIVGRTVRVNGGQKTVVGVLPPGFGFLSSKASLFLPFSSDPERRGPAARHSGNGSTLIGRLRPDATLDEAQAQIDVHNASVAGSYPQASMIAEAGFRSIVAPLHADHVRSFRAVLLLLQAGALFLLLIGAVNLANLLLVRAAGRGNEMAIRQSLGAGRRQVLGQVLAETELIALLGGLAGLALGAGGIRALTVLGVDRLPLGSEVGFNARLAMVTVAGSLLVGVFVAAPVAWMALRNHLANALNSESRTGTTNPAGKRLRHGFIVAQIALAFVLLAGAALQGILYDVPALPFGTIGVSAALLILVSIAACLVPTWRASRVHPAEALRSE